MLSISTLKSRLMFRSPFVGCVAIAMPCTIDDTIPTAGTDGWEIKFNSQFMGTLTPDEQVFVMAHEVAHNILCASLRRKHRERRLFNIAADHAANWLLSMAGFTVPNMALKAPEYKDLASEVVYEQMKQQQPKPPTNPGNKPKPGNQPGQPGSSGGSSGDNQQPIDTDDLGGQKPVRVGKVSDSPDAEEAQAGDIVINDKPEDEALPPRPGKPYDPGDDILEVRPGKGESVEEHKERLDQKIKDVIQKAAMQAKAMGSLPGDIGRMVEEMTKPKIDWRQILSSFLQRAIVEETSYRRLNRRTIGMGIALPSNNGEDLKNVAVFIDTSGSIGQKEYDIFATEVRTICEAFKIDGKMIFCDSEVHHVIDISSREEISLDNIPGGGGGTDFAPAIKWAEENMDKPAVGVYLTDLYGGFGEAPDFPMLWVVLPNGYDKAPFGQIVKMEED